MRRIRTVFLLLAGMFSLMHARAQSGSRISGRVVDSATKVSVAGASIIASGSKRGTSTSSDGRFSIVALPGEELQITAIGFSSARVRANDGVIITLSSTAGNLQDVVVVGYGTQRRANLTSAVSTITGEQLIKRPVASTSMALQGFAPGVTVRQGSGQPGGDGGQINIRGIGSVSSGNNPLIIVDGVEGVSLNDIDPNMIENISILKDAASTAVYGVRATNGVILVKTKRGQAGKTSLSYNAFLSQQTPTNMPKTLSAIDNMILNNEAVANTGSTALPYSQALIDFYRNNAPNNFSVFNTDWQDLIFQNNGLLQNHNLIISGGSDNASFLASGTYLNQQGLIVNNSFTKYDLRMNGDIKIKKWLTFTSDLFFTKATNIVPAGMSPTSIIQRGISMAKNFPGKFEQGKYGDAGQSNSFNPIAFAEESGIQKTVTPTLSARFALRAEVIKNLFLDVAYNNRSSFTQSVRANKTYDVYTPNPATSTLNYSAAIGDSTINYSTNRTNANQYYASGTYNFMVASNHNIKVQGGFQAIDNYSENTSATRFGLLYPDRPYFNSATGSQAPTVGGGATDNAVAGFFGRVNYDYKNRYLLELTGRRDGSSRFSQLADKQWGIFSGLSAGWIISKENFFKNINFINFAKIRGSYGSLGNQEVQGGSYPFAAQLNARTDYYFNNNLSIGSSLNNVQNVNISWETSTQYGAGIDLSLLKNKLSLTFDYYEKKVDDMIIDLPLPLYVGYAGTTGTVPTNAGSMINKGWEFSTTYRSKVGKLNYSLTGNLSDVKNMVTNTRGLDIVTSAGLIAREGFPINSYNLYQTNGLYQTGDNVNLPRNTTRVTGPGDIRYLDVNGDSVLNASDRRLTGNNFPRYEYSLDLNLNYQNFDLSIFLYGVGKRDNYISGVGVEPFNGGNWIASGLENVLDRWTPKNPGGRYPRLYSGGNQNYLPSTYWLQNGAFMRVKHITLGYNVPAKWLAKATMQQFRVYVNVVNPYTFSKYEPGFDPEISNTSGAFYPIMRTATVGLNIRF